MKTILVDFIVIVICKQKQIPATRCHGGHYDSFQLTLLRFGRGNVI